MSAKIILRYFSILLYNLSSYIYPHTFTHDFRLCCFRAFIDGFFLVYIYIYIDVVFVQNIRLVRPKNGFVIVRELY